MSAPGRKPEPGWRERDAQVPYSVSQVPTKQTFFVLFWNTYPPHKLLEKPQN